MEKIIESNVFHEIEYIIAMSSETHIRKEIRRERTKYFIFITLFIPTPMRMPVEQFISITAKGIVISGIFSNVISMVLPKRRGAKTDENPRPKVPPYIGTPSSFIFG